MVYFFYAYTTLAYYSWYTLYPPRNKASQSTCLVLLSPRNALTSQAIPQVVYVLCHIQNSQFFLLNVLLPRLMSFLLTLLNKFYVDNFITSWLQFVLIDIINNSFCNYLRDFFLLFSSELPIF